MDQFSERLQILAVQAMPFLIAIVFHEVAHGMMAKRFGDPTAEEAGRLTLNPLSHLDPVGTFLPLASMLMGIPILFGWAKPVPIDPRRFSHRRSGLFMVAAAGPLMNFFLAFVSAAIYCAASLALSEESASREFILNTAIVSVSINYALGIFNLLPIPPLDGSRLIESMLPKRAALQFEKVSRYGFAILLLLLFSGALNLLQVPIQGAARLTVYWMAQLFEWSYSLLVA